MSPTQFKSIVETAVDAETGPAHAGTDQTPRSTKHKKPSESQRLWLRRGLDQAGGKLPLFLDDGQRVSERTVKSCIQNGWAEPWLKNPIKPGWQICRLTARGRAVVAD